jgi:hypothetical protein
MWANAGNLELFALHLETTRQVKAFCCRACIAPQNSAALHRNMVEAAQQKRFAVTFALSCRRNRHTAQTPRACIGATGQRFMKE